MSDKIESLLATCSRFADDFNALHLNHRIAIVSFGDLRVRGDKIQNTAFTSQCRGHQEEPAKHSAETAAAAMKASLRWKPWSARCLCPSDRMP